jgi:hypothetical protein
MSVKMMVGAEKAGNPGVVTVYNFTGHEFDRVIHASGCPNRNEYGMGEGCVGYRCSYAGPLYIEETYVGLVLSLRERNGYDEPYQVPRSWGRRLSCQFRHPCFEIDRRVWTDFR